MWTSSASVRVLQNHTIITQILALSVENINAYDTIYLAQEQFYHSLSSVD